MSENTNKILIEDGWQERVRDKMGVYDSYLPDSAIEQPDCIDVAEANIMNQLPRWNEVSSTGRIYLEAATVLECCVLLCPSMEARLPIKEQGPHETHSLKMDWQEKQMQFEDERNNFLDKILDLDFDGSLTSGLSKFTVTYPRRC